MTKIEKKTDPAQLDLFEAASDLRTKQEQILGVNISAGTLNIDTIIRELISSALKKTTKSRYQVAASMSELVGIEISKYQIDSWSAESKDHHRFPIIYLPAFISATGDKNILRFLCEKCNGMFIEGRESLHLELGRLDFSKRQAAKRERAIKDLLETTAG